MVVTAVVVGAVVAGGSAAVLAGQSRGSGGGVWGGEGLSSSVAVPASPDYDYESGTASDSGSGSAASEEYAPAPSVAPSGGDAAGSAADRSAPVESLPPGAVGRDLIRSAQLSIEVDDAGARTRQVRTAAAAVGGIVVEEQSGDTGGWLTLRVPADSLDRLVDDIAGLGKVVQRSSQVSDATEQVTDLDARVASQRASVDRVRTLLAQAQSIGDIVAIESELADREAELDSLVSRLAGLRDQVALSTLTVDLRGPGAPVPPVEPDGPAGFTDGLAAGWEGLLAVGTAAAAVIGFVLPLLPLVVIGFVLVLLGRRLVRGRRAPAPAPAPTPGATP
ncbi:DUF4349 domain-containing protein [Pseudonocardia lacus]|uniref:DUF4349 domain-containing protein n=1 Tax=Pseudonocardia lacus TaxID=2835865 RepID=UPI001BDCFFE1|nr:DUF4349 domain-containing protein [Pseudonocardia lacus]